MISPLLVEKTSRKAVCPLLLTILIESMGFAMLTPLLAVEFAADSTSPIGVGFSEDERYIIYGFATGLYPAMMFFGAPLLGRLSDQFGRKALLLVCSAGIVVSYMVLSFVFMSGSIVLLMAGRILGGATAAGQPISLAALVDVSAPANKDFWLSMGMLGSALGFVVGPTVGAFFSDNRIAPEFNTRTPLLITGLLGCFNFALLWAFFREPRQSQAGRVLRVGPSWASAIFSLGEAFRRSGLRRISLVFLLQEMAWGAYFFFVPTFLIDQFEATGTASSLFMAVMGIGFCMSFAVVMPVLTKQFTCRAITSGGLLAFLILVAISALSPNIFLEWVVVLPISVASAVSYGALIILFTDHSLEDTKGEIMGITAALSAVAFGAISFIGGGLAALDERVPLICACILTTLACVAHHVQLHKTVQQ